MSMMNIGLQHKDMSMGGFRDASMLEQRRNAMNEQLVAEEKQRKASAIGTGAGIGAGVGGPWGALIGAAAGWLSEELF